MRIIILTDLEGISGVCAWKQTSDRTSVYYQEARRLLMGDVNAAVDGCIEGGATDIVVVDNHGASYNFVPEMMHPKAQYLVGQGRPPYRQMEQLYRGFDAAILLGHHAMAGTSDGILRHTMSNVRGNQYWLNGREMGETGMFVVLLGDFGVPIVMVTGDQAHSCEAEALLGEQVVQVTVKWGFAPEYGLLLAPETAHRRIREGAKEAMSRISHSEPFVMKPPIRGRVRFPDKSTADGFRPKRAHRVDDYTFEVDFERACDVLEF